MTENIGEKLRCLRTAKNLTQQQLCDKISKQGFILKRNTYTKYEKGTRTLPYELLCQLAIFYGVSLNYIFEIDDFLSDTK